MLVYKNFFQLILNTYQEQHPGFSSFMEIPGLKKAIEATPCSRFVYRKTTSCLQSVYGEGAEVSKIIGETPCP